MKTVQHPIKNRFDFGILFAVVGWFIASFFVFGKLVPALGGPPTLSALLFGGNIIAIGLGMMAYASHAQTRNKREAQRVGEECIEVSDAEIAIIERLHIPCTLHRYDVWPKDAPKRFPRFWAEFPDADAKVLFLMARPATSR